MRIRPITIVPAELNPILLDLESSFADLSAPSSLRPRHQQNFPPQLLKPGNMPLIQLQPHPFTSLPSHSSLPDNTSRPDLKEFTRIALHEALEHLTSLPTYKPDPKLRSSSPSQAKVKLLRAWRKPSDQSSTANEFWVARQSEHVDSAERGTASWSEFEAGLRENHAEHEMEYTPSVTSVERLLEWKGGEIAQLQVDGVSFRGVIVEGECYLVEAWYT